MTEKKEKRIVDYRIAYNDTIWDLETLVRNMISLGFEPTGGVCLGKTGGYYQALVKLEGFYQNLLKKDIPVDHPAR